MLKIVHIPNKVLSSPTKPVEQFDSYLSLLVKDMQEALDACVDPQGVGLAATQVGLGISLFIMKPNPDSKTVPYINPKILQIEDVKTKSKKKKDDDDTPLEGCLSIPHIWSPINRASRVELEYQDIKGNKQQKWFEGFESIIVQHEVDHLQGVLFTQRALEQGSQLYEEHNGELYKIKSI